MTLPEIMDKENVVDARVLKTMGNVMTTCIKQAYKKKRLTWGMTSCAELLKNNPSTVMMCVLPHRSEEDVGMNIHCTLIQAFCRENGISLIELQDSEKKVAAFLTTLTLRDFFSNSADTSCLILQYPKNLNKEEKMLIQFCQEMLMIKWDAPLLKLPD